MTRKGTGWTDDEDTLLKALVKTGRTGSDVAHELAAAGFPPRSRNAVIGRIFRLRTETGRPEVTTANRIHGAKVAHAKAAKAKEKEAAAPVPAISAAAARKPGPGRHGLGGPPASLAPITATVDGWPKPRGPHAIRFLDAPYRGRCKMPLWGNDEPIEDRFVCGEPCDPARPYCPSCHALTVSVGTPSEQAAIRAAKSIAKKEAA